MFKANRSFIGNFELRQHSANCGDIELSDYDLALSFVSWETRCLSICDIDLSTDQLLICDFKTPSESTERKSNYKTMNEWATKNKNIRAVKSLKLSNSVDCHTNFQLLAEAIGSIVKAKNRQLRILVDISGSPKSILSFLIGFGFTRGVFKELHFFYPHSDYQDKVEAEMIQGIGQREFYRFTYGHWAPILIPYLEGELRPSSQRHMIVMMGAETSATEAFLKRYQPDQLQFVLPLPSVTAEMDKNLGFEVERLMDRMELVESDFVSVKPYDMLTASNKVFELIANADKESDLMVACVGTKPHAIGASIATFLNKSAALVCRVPMKYREVPGPGNGKATLFEIEDLSAF